MRKNCPLFRNLQKVSTTESSLSFEPRDFEKSEDLEKPEKQPKVTSN
jgi:hypothetical protein